MVSLTQQRQALAPLYVAGSLLGISDKDSLIRCPEQLAAGSDVHCRTATTELSICFSLLRADASTKSCKSLVMTLSLWAPAIGPSYHPDQCEGKAA